jgi:hypothetical protein
MEATLRAYASAPQAPDYLVAGDSPEKPLVGATTAAPRSRQQQDAALHSVPSLTIPLSSSVVRMPSGLLGPASPSFRKNRNAFLIGVAGGTASGKTTVSVCIARSGYATTSPVTHSIWYLLHSCVQVCDRIMQRLHDQCVVMLAQVRRVSVRHANAHGLVDCASNVARCRCCG